MRGATTVKMRGLVAAIVLVVGGVVAAQQSVPPPPDMSNILLQVRTFEMSLKVAVEHAAQSVSDSASKAYPGLVVGWSSDPVARGWLQPHFGYVFEVEVPGILPVSLSVIYMNRQFAAPPSARTVPIAPARPVSNTTTKPVSATGAVPDPDPMTVSPAAGFDPVRELSDTVREALINALLENSRSLPLKDTDWLAISAAPAELPIPNPLEPRKRRLLLQITGANLAIYHRDPSKKDAVKQLIVESRF
jgi:hypothetical protein